MAIYRQLMNSGVTPIEEMLVASRFLELAARELAARVISKLKCPVFIAHEVSGFD